MPPKFRLSKSNRFPGASPSDVDEQAAATREGGKPQATSRETCLRSEGGPLPRLYCRAQLGLQRLIEPMSWPHSLIPVTSTVHVSVLQPPDSSTRHPVTPSIRLDSSFASTRAPSTRPDFSESCQKSELGCVA